MYMPYLEGSAALVYISVFAYSRLAMDVTLLSNTGYRSELGLRHKLTLQAEQHCETLEQQLGHTHYSTH